MYEFEPALGSKTFLPTEPSSSHLYIVANTKATDQNVDDQPGKPEVWTNVEGQWSSVPFLPLDPRTSIAALPLYDLKGGRVGEWTLRLVGGDGGLTWLGDEKGNSTIALVEAVETGPPSVRTESFTLRNGQKSADFELGEAPLGFAILVQRSLPTWFVPKLVKESEAFPEGNETPFIVVRTRNRVRAYLSVCTRAVSCHREARGGRKLYAVAGVDLGGPMEAHVVIGDANEGDLDKLVKKMVERSAAIIAEADGLSLKRPDGSAGTGTSKLSYCTWNSLGPDYKASQVVEALTDLSNTTEIVRDSIDTVLLDDGWQDIRLEERTGLRRLRTFGASLCWSDVGTTKTSSEGMRRDDSGYGSPSSEDQAWDPIKALSESVSVIKEKVSYVGVWITLEGYWHSIDPNGPLAKTYGPLMEIKLASGTIWYMPHKDRLPGFWCDYFNALKSAGVDFVKVDNQSGIDNTFADGAYKVQLARTMRAAYAKVWGDEGKLINCMAHTSRTWCGPLGAGLEGSRKALMRHSYDFYPTIRDSHRWHVSGNTTMAIWSRHLDFIPDFDMLMTRHDYASYHAVLRAMSPAPIYITDTRGSHDEAVFNALVGEKPDLSLSVVQPLRGDPLPARLSNNAFVDDLDQNGAGANLALKVGLAFPRAKGSAAIVAWNCLPDDRSVKDVLTRRDLADALSLGPSTAKGTNALDYAVYLVRSDSVRIVRDLRFDIETQVHRASSEPLIGLDIPSKSHEVVSVAPLICLTADDKKSVWLACVGLIDKTMPLAAVRSIGSTVAVSRKASRPVTSEQTRRIWDTSRVLNILRSIWSRDGSGSVACNSLKGDLVKKPFATIASETKGLVHAVTLFVAATFYSILSRCLPTRMVSAEHRALLDRAEPAHTDSRKEPWKSIQSKGGSEVLVIRTKFLGRLAFVVAGDAKLDYSASIGGSTVPRSCLFVSTRANHALVTIDMVAAFKDGRVATDADCFVVRLTISPSI